MSRPPFHLASTHTNAATASTVAAEVGVGLIEGVAMNAMSLRGVVMVGSRETRTALRKRVALVIASSSFKEMRLPNAAAIIAVVKNHQVGRAKGVSVGKDLKADRPRQAKGAITFAVLSPSPFPALSEVGHVDRDRAVFVDMPPEADFGWYGGRAFSMLPEHLNVLSGVTVPDVSASRHPSILLQGALS